MTRQELVAIIVSEVGRKRLAKAYRTPFRYDQRAQSIFTATNMHVLDMRGWSWLGCITDGDKVQDAMGHLIVELLNTEFEKIRDI